MWVLPVSPPTCALHRLSKAINSEMVVEPVHTKGLVEQPEAILWPRLDSSIELPPIKITARLFVATASIRAEQRASGQRFDAHAAPGFITTNFDTASPARRTFMFASATGSGVKPKEI